MPARLIVRDGARAPPHHEGRELPFGAFDFLTIHPRTLILRSGAFAASRRMRPPLPATGARRLPLRIGIAHAAPAAAVERRPFAFGLGETIGYRVDRGGM